MKEIVTSFAIVISDRCDVCQTATFIFHCGVDAVVAGIIFAFKTVNEQIKTASTFDVPRIVLYYFFDVAIHCDDLPDLCVFLVIFSKFSANNGEQRLVKRKVGPYGRSYAGQQQKLKE